MADQSSSENSNHYNAPKRFPTKENAQIQVYGRAGTVHCRMANLSATGALLEINNVKSMPKRGDIIRITIALRQLNKSHTLDAEIVWCKGSGIGISFIKRDQIYDKLAQRTANS